MTNPRRDPPPTTRLGRRGRPPSAQPPAPSPAKPRLVSEETFQSQVCRWLNRNLAGNSWYTAIPLGGGGFSRGIRLKRTGTKRGVPDLLVINDGRAVFLELKAKRGSLSDSQLYCHEQIRRARSPVAMCKTLGEVKDALLAAGVPLKEPA